MTLAPHEEAVKHAVVRNVMLTITGDGATLVETAPHASVEINVTAAQAKELDLPWGFTVKSYANTVEAAGDATFVEVARQVRLARELQL